MSIIMSIYSIEEILKIAEEEMKGMTEKEREEYINAIEVAVKRKAE